jgi:hypothetical protein
VPLKYYLPCNYIAQSDYQGTALIIVVKLDCFVVNGGAAVLYLSFYNQVPLRKTNLVAAFCREVLSAKY